MSIKHNVHTANVSHAARVLRHMEGANDNGSAHEVAAAATHRINDGRESKLRATSLASATNSINTRLYTASCNDGGRGSGWSVCVHGNGTIQGKARGYRGAL